jgi:hypothetical protein
VTLSPLALVTGRKQGDEGRWAASPGTASAMNVHDVSTGVIPPGRSSPPGPGARPAGTPFLIALAAQRSERRAETGYAASAFFEEDEDFSDFFDDSEDFEESPESFDFDSDLSPPSLPDRSISRLRRFVP